MVSPTQKQEWQLQPGFIMLFSCMAVPCDGRYHEPADMLTSMCWDNWCNKKSQKNNFDQKNEDLTYISTTESMCGYMFLSF